MGITSRMSASTIAAFVSSPLALHVQTSPKLATSPHHQQMSPQSSPGLMQARLHSSPGTSPHAAFFLSASPPIDEGDSPLNLTKPKNMFLSKDGASFGVPKSSSGGSSPTREPHPAFQPPPAHSNHMRNLLNPLPPPDLASMMKRAAPFNAAVHYVSNPYAGIPASHTQSLPTMPTMSMVQHTAQTNGKHVQHALDKVQTQKRHLTFKINIILVFVIWKRTLSLFENNIIPLWVKVRNINI